MCRTRDHIENQKKKSCWKNQKDWPGLERRFFFFLYHIKTPHPHGWETELPHTCLSHESCLNPTDINISSLQSLSLIPLWAFCIIVSIWLSLHSLQYKMGCWGASKENDRQCIFCLEPVQKSEDYTLIQRTTFNHIQVCFLHIVNVACSFNTFLSHSQCALSTATFISQILEQREKSLLNFAFGSIGHIWTSICQHHH